MRASEPSAASATRASRVASNSENQSASRARSSADSADSVRRAAPRSCAPGTRRRRAPLRKTPRTRAVLRRAPGSRVERPANHPFRARTCSWIHSARSPGFGYRMRVHGKKLHGLAASKGCATSRPDDAGQAATAVLPIIVKYARASRNALAHAARVRGGSVPDGAGRDLNRYRGGATLRTRHPPDPSPAPSWNRGTASRMHRYNPLTFAPTPCALRR